MLHDPYTKIQFLEDLHLLLQVTWTYRVTPPRCEDLLYHICPSRLIPQNIKAPLVFTAPWTHRIEQWETVISSQTHLPWMVFMFNLQLGGCPIPPLKPTASLPCVTGIWWLSVSNFSCQLELRKTQKVVQLLPDQVMFYHGYHPSSESPEIP